MIVYSLFLHARLLERRKLEQWVNRFPYLFCNINWFIFARSSIFLKLIFIYIFWYLYVVYICNKENPYLDAGVYSSCYSIKKKKKTEAKYKLTIKVLQVIEKSSAKKVTLNLSLKWPLNYLWLVFSSTPRN